MPRLWITPSLSLFSSLLLSLLFNNAALANSLTVQVLDIEGQPFEGAVVELQHPDFSRSENLPEAAMDQVNKQFAPYLLVVEQGSAVAFPNSDSIKHHVFSFSAAKRFQLKLYKDRPPEPLIFDKPGVVALGCNIHDWMVGYIYVAQSNQVQESNSQGEARFELGDKTHSEPYQLAVWHPRFKAQDAQRLTAVESSTKTLVFQLTKPLHPEIDNQGDEFDNY